MNRVITPLDFVYGQMFKKTSLKSIRTTSNIPVMRSRNRTQELQCSQEFDSQGGPLSIFINCYGFQAKLVYTHTFIDLDSQTVDYSSSR